MNYKHSSEVQSLRIVADTILGGPDPETFTAIGILGLRGNTIAEQSAIEEVRQYFISINEMSEDQWRDIDLPRFANELVSDVLTKGLSNKLAALGTESELEPIDLNSVTSQVNALYELLRHKRGEYPELETMFDLVSQLKYGLDNFYTGMQYQLALLNLISTAPDNEYANE